MTHFTSITIGRNIKGTATPLYDVAWDTFQGDVVDALSVAAHSVRAGIIVPVSTFHGTGEWDGVAEDSALVTVITSAPVDLEWLRDRLAVLAAVYGQDAIALSSGSSELVTPH